MDLSAAQLAAGLDESIEETALRPDYLLRLADVAAMQDAGLEGPFDAVTVPLRVPCSADEVMRRLGEALRAHRRARCRDALHVVARRAGLSTSALAGAERGKGRLRVAVAILLADSVGASFASLLRNAGP